MIRSNTKLTIYRLSGVFFVLLASIFVLLDSRDASAYSASISTSNSITLNAKPSGDGTTIHTESITVTSDCRNGYNLTIATPEGSDLYAGGDNTNSASITAVDGTSALSNSNNTNKWGYTLTSNPTGSTVFSPLSATEATLKTFSQTASPNSDINDTFSIAYGVKIDSTVAPNQYKMANSGAIVYSLTMEPTCLLYTVQYQDNGADNPNGMGTTDSDTGEKSVKQINISEDTKITLLAPNFKKAGYSFLGWSTDSQAYAHFTDNDNTNDPVIYGPMEDVVIDSSVMATANTRNIINMYAVWIPALRTDPSNQNSAPVYFQDWDNPNTNLPHDGCSTLTATTFDDTVTDEKGKITVTKDSIVALTDKRDDEVYTIAKLADDNCWMIENLRLEHEGTVGNNKNDSSITNQSLSQGYGGTTGTYGNFVGLADPESANFSNVTTANSIYKSDGSGDVFDFANNTLEDIGTSNYSGYRFPRYNSNNTQSLIDSTTYTQNYANAASPSGSGTFPGANLYSYGNYYTWAAAMANTNYYTSSSTSESANTSICPSNWHLPSSNGANKEYGTLSQRYGGNGSNQSGVGTGDIMSNRFRSFPNNFLYSGYFVGSSASNCGTNGSYWSRSAYTYYHSYYLSLRSTELYPSSYYNNNSGKGNGFSVRCLIGSSDVQVTLDSNNGTGAVSRAFGTAGSTIRLPSSSNPSASIAQPSYAFKNWNTAPDGSGISYTSSYTIPAGSTGETLYAQWIPQYTITYVNNCQTYASANSACTQSVSDGTSKQKINLTNNPSAGTETGTLAAYNKWTLTGWKIVGWSTVADNSDNTNTEYKVSSTYTVPAGSSVGSSITLYAHWVPVYSIQYDGNNADNPNGMGTTDSSTGVKSVKQTNVGEGDPVVLLASNFKRTGYGFAGWSTNPNATVTSGDKIYGPMETIDAPAYPTNGTNIITMYAVWVAAEKDTNDNPVYLQDFTASDCNALTKADFNTTTGVITPGSVIALTDKRDDEVYTIAKLADDNCWMIENLRLEHEGTVGNNKNDSSVTNQSLSQGYGGTTGTYGNFVGLADPESANFSSSTTANSIYKSDGSGDVLDSANNTLEDIGTSNYPAYRFPRYNSNNTLSLVDSTTYTQNCANASSPSDSGTNYRTSSNIYGYGNYYTWAAAMANTNYYNNPSTSEAANASICPSNWHLPSSYGIDKEFGTLSTSYGGNGNSQSGVGTGDIISNRFRTFPNNFLYSGYFYNSSASDRGSYGYYWSRSTYYSDQSYRLSLKSTKIEPAFTSQSKSLGFSVRCLLGN